MGKSNQILLRSALASKYLITLTQQLIFWNSGKQVWQSLRKQGLTFHANCLLRRQFAWNVKACFWGKIRKNIPISRLLKFYPAWQVLRRRVMMILEPFSPVLHKKLWILIWKASTRGLNTHVLLKSRKQEDHGGLECSPMLKSQSRSLSVYNIH